MRASVTNPREIVRIFVRDRETHLYGLADLEEPFWSNSTWFRQGPSVVGRVSVGDGWTAGYAMTRAHPTHVLDLLETVVSAFPTGTWFTGPIGTSQCLGLHSDIDAKGYHLRMILRSEKPRAVDQPNVVRLDRSNLAAVEDLHRSDPGAAFFLPTMLDEATFVGVWDGDMLVSSAGTHVASRRYGVAALGAIITRPGYRGQGLATATTSALCRLLQPTFRTIGLNVAASNTTAVKLYETLGFRTHTTYEEVELS